MEFFDWSDKLLIYDFSFSNNWWNILGFSNFKTFSLSFWSWLKVLWFLCFLHCSVVLNKSRWYSLLCRSKYPPLICLAPVTVTKINGKCKWVLRQTIRRVAIEECRTDLKDFFSKKILNLKSSAKKSSIQLNYGGIIIQQKITERTLSWIWLLISSIQFADRNWTFKLALITIEASEPARQPSKLYPSLANSLNIHEKRAHNFDDDLMLKFGAMTVNALARGNFKKLCLKLMKFSKKKFCWEQDPSGVEWC